ncbi:MAG: pyridoxamine 5'-phosphate oxidase family protein [Candidatus Geothermincolia bacterium]
MEMPAEMISLFAADMAAKFLATLGEDGKPNVGVVVTLQPPPGEPERLIFGEFLMLASRGNLERDSRVAAAVVSMKLKMATLVGDFRGFEKTGPYIDAINSSTFIRYNAYTGVRQAGIVDVREVGAVRNIGYHGVARDLAGISLGKLAFRGAKAARTVEVPGIVLRKFLAPAAVKAVAVTADDGYPRIFPVMAMASVGKGLLAFKISGYNRGLSDLETPRAAGCATLTMDAISYKVKGTLLAAGHSLGLLAVEEVFNASPPRAGDRIA